MRDSILMLKELNRDLLQLDWKQGARNYVKYYMTERGREFIEHFSLSKPFAPLPQENSAAQLDENVAYLINFVNTVQLLRLRYRARILDVACGGGWVSHFLTRMGYTTFGFDICADFIELAKRRLATDPLIKNWDHEVSKMFAVHDIEADALGPEHSDAYDAVILESCLHHFFDPIQALRHLVKALNFDGLLVIIEGENRSGLIRSEFQLEMEKTNTLERPLPRTILNEILEISGLPYYEYVGSANGWFCPRDPKVRNLTQLIHDDCRQKNIVIAAKSDVALSRVFPWRSVGSDVAISFGTGFYEEQESGWRWAAPYSQLYAEKDLIQLKLLLLSEVPARLRREQAIYIHGQNGLRKKIMIKDDRPVSAEIGSVQKGDVLTICSGEFFVPANHGGDDLRQLSFALRLRD